MIEIEDVFSRMKPSPVSLPFLLILKHVKLHNSGYDDNGYSTELE